MARSCQDWRDLSAAEAIPLVEAEAQAWASGLEWEVADAWRQLEPARAAGHLPGLVYRDGTGSVAGWCCYVIHQDTLQVAMLVAETLEATTALVAGIASSPEAGRARSWATCVRHAAPGVGQVLAGHGFTVSSYRYLSVVPAVTAGPLPGIRGWQAADAAAAARLFARAYGHSTDVRAFAVHGTAEEWRDYTDGLVTRPGCGRFVPGASFVLDVPAVSPGDLAVSSSADLDGAILTTDLGRRTAHVAQIAVDPIARGLGLGRALLAASMTAAAASGFERITLLVAEANLAAVQLYEDLGFRDRAAFIVAVNRQPRRSSRVALATGGARTRR